MTSSMISTAFIWFQEVTVGLRHDEVLHVCSPTQAECTRLRNRYIYTLHPHAVHLHVTITLKHYLKLKSDKTSALHYILLNIRWLYLLKAVERVTLLLDLTSYSKSFLRQINIYICKSESREIRSHFKNHGSICQRKWSLTVLRSQ